MLEKHPMEYLVWALNNEPGEISGAMIETVLMDSARSNGKRPAYLKVAVTDEVVKELKGSVDKRQNLILMISIPMATVEKADSPIILPS